MGATLFIQDDSGPFQPDRFIQNLHEYEITTICAPPTAFRQLVLKKQLTMIKQNKPRALECCVAGGEALNPDVINTWKQATGLDIFEGYGQVRTPHAPSLEDLNGALTWTDRDSVAMR
jgi:medium-chain acyl-CoA synthetase